MIDAIRRVLTTALLLGMVAERPLLSDEPAVRVEIHPDRRIINTHDPLLLKIALENVSTEDQTVFNPSRNSETLHLHMEHRHGSGEFFQMDEAEGGIGLLVKVGKVVLKPKQRLVTYATVFRDTSGDFHFRHHRQCHIYATVKTPSGVIQSPPIVILVNSRGSKLEHEDELIKKEYRVIRQALLTEEVVLSGPQGDAYRDPRTVPEKLAMLEGLRDELRGGYLRDTLVWRIDLLKIKYGSEIEELAARQRLEEIRPTLKEPSRDLLGLLLAKVNLEQGHLQAATAELNRIPDDSPQKRQLLQIIAGAEK